MSEVHPKNKNGKPCEFSIYIYGGHMAKYKITHVWMQPHEWEGEADDEESALEKFYEDAGGAESEDGYWEDDLMEISEVTAAEEEISS
jgi:hypothetical protein